MLFIEIPQIFLLQYFYFDDQRIRQSDCLRAFWDITEATDFPGHAVLA